MKSIARFLLAALCAVPFGADCATPVPATRGSNLTAYNGGSGATNNNNWNGLLNSRTGVDAAEMPPADFGNCNAIVLRCAQPKCANGGCTNMDVTYAIVSGCVQSNDSCKKYGDDLIQYISAQLVAQSTAKANAAAAAAQTAAANAAAQQNAQQMAQMQAQMQQMQAEMAQQNAETVAQLQSALEEQKQLTAQAIADANAARTPTVTTTAPATSGGDTAATSTISGLSVAQQIAAQNGVSADVLAREQVTGQIMSSIENAEKQMEELKRTMLDVFDYAGCDTKGNNCSGPKRVKMFKQKAIGFFDPYENVLGELYDALISAQSVGVDITDIYMMLNGSCNVWGQFLCSESKNTSGTKVICDKVVKTIDKDGKVEETRECREVETNVVNLVTYDEHSCLKDGGLSRPYGRVRGGHECFRNRVVPPEDDTSCILNKTLVDNKDDPVQREWLWAESNDVTGAHIRVGCASSALESSKLFRNLKKQASIDIETLEKIISQDAPAVISKYRRNSDTDDTIEQLKYCAAGADQYADLEKWVATKTLPTKNLCVKNSFAVNQVLNNIPLTATSERAIQGAFAQEVYEKCMASGDYGVCSEVDGSVRDMSAFEFPVKSQGCCASREQIMCVTYAGGYWGSGAKRGCNCETSDGRATNLYRPNGKCMEKEAYCKELNTMPLTDKNDCYLNCEKYCTTDNGKRSVTNQCRDDNGNLQDLKTGESCKPSWNEAEGRCVCH